MPVGGSHIDQTHRRSPLTEIAIRSWRAGTHRDQQPTCQVRRFLGLNDGPLPRNSWWHPNRVSFRGASDKVQGVATSGLGPNSSLAKRWVPPSSPKGCPSDTALQYGSSNATTGSRLLSSREYSPGANVGNARWWRWSRLVQKSPACYRLPRVLQRPSGLPTACSREAAVQGNRRQTRRKCR